MEMALRTSNLSLPEGFVEMDREEMMYVDGGGCATIEITRDTINKFRSWAYGAVTSVFVAAVVTEILSKYVPFAATLCTLGPAGITGAIIIGGLIGAVAGFIAQELAYRIFTAIDNFKYTLYNKWYLPRFTIRI